MDQTNIPRPIDTDVTIGRVERAYAVNSIIIIAALSIYIYVNTHVHVCSVVMYMYTLHTIIKQAHLKLKAKCSPMSL